jgi:ribosomal-protein-alanine N-acetyltransferase
MRDSDFYDLCTERLRLEPFARHHSEGVFTLWSSPEVCRLSGEAHDWEGRPIHLPARSPIDSDKILDFFIRRATEGSGVRWAVISKKSGRCIGAVGLNSIAPTAELAYHLHPNHWGSGYGTEACAAVLEWCGLNLPGVAIDAFIEAENVASICLARRLGFEETTTLREGAGRYVHSGP